MMLWNRCLNLFFTKFRYFFVRYFLNFIHSLNKLVLKCSFNLIFPSPSATFYLRNGVFFAGNSFVFFYFFFVFNDNGTITFAECGRFGSIWTRER